MNVNENINIGIDFSNLEEIYLDNSKDFILILEKIKAEYEKYFILIKEHIKAENLEDFRKTRHKISATLLLLKLIHFHEYLTFLKEHFTIGFTEQDSIIKNLETSFDKIQLILSEKLDTLNKK